MDHRLLNAIVAIQAITLCIHSAYSLDNGLARTPPMGWCSWERFRCDTDCVRDPDNCVSEHLYKTMADLVVSEGYKDLGYEFINMDDCWMASTRDSNGRLYGDPTRFPNGMKALADYVHSKGLKLGIYESMGYATCQKLPGTFGHIETDAQTFADWGIDMVKMDTCHTPSVELTGEGFMNFSRALNGTGRPIVYSCEWAHVQSSNFSIIAETCNTFRNYIDIQDSWTNVMTIIEFFASKQDIFTNVSGPGSYSDPDMLIVGDYSLSIDQSKAQMALWSIMAAQLMMSNDLRTLAPWAKEILQNKEVIAVNQDPLGIMGKRVFTTAAKIEVWAKPLSGESFAAVVFSKRTDMPYNCTFTISKLNFTHAAGYKVRDLFLSKDLGTFLPGDDISVMVNPVGVVMIRADPVMNYRNKEEKNRVISTLGDIIYSFK
ncbi:alpha-N-acetylgalactosaminidase [Strongylocentrotus purpuratus]|uniref:Alpha-galactosidase n=1 Tax=Strongylocentrotus purpuratus TaxID=7668 RepID=A0A7M7TGK2_STRPU|nr:alpha-N-acetylgalactosaminidase [Strongylocentrotus purpuratus]XP_786834.2 alpha-N-acetylgalactosaminidase [Strongylocentrotus purpuratus]|eukprot:XP_011684091.1 PREDICTED: alpha-N-acetylgalactosaminidase [Strongylocentrotus purpuratus]